MRVRQNVRHWAGKEALTTPVVGDVAVDRLVDLHTSIFLNRADEDRREERRDHLDDFFRATMDAYVDALEAGVQRGDGPRDDTRSSELRLFHPRLDGDDGDPGRRTRDALSPVRGVFFDRGITIDDLLGEFRPVGGVAPASATPERSTGSAYEHAVAGFADDVYVETGDGETVGGGDVEAPEDVDPAAAPGLDEEEASV